MEIGKLGLEKQKQVNLFETYFDPLIKWEDESPICPCTEVHWETV